MAQNWAFTTELNSLGSASNKKVTKLKQNSKLDSLRPFVDEDEILRAVGRLKSSNVNNNCVLPILLPKTVTVTELLIK